MANTNETTTHNHQVIFGRREAGCPRCAGTRCDECQPEFCKCCGEEMSEDGCQSCASEDAKAHAADMANDIDDFNDPRDL